MKVCSKLRTSVLGPPRITIVTVDLMGMLWLCRDDVQVQGSNLILSLPCVSTQGNIEGDGEILAFFSVSKLVVPINELP